jgi:hypothetical protein
MQHLRFSELHGTREVMKCKVIGVHPREVEKEAK